MQHIIFTKKQEEEREEGTVHIIQTIKHSSTQAYLARHWHQVVYLPLTFDLRSIQSVNKAIRNLQYQKHLQITS